MFLLNKWAIEQHLNQNNLFNPMQKIDLLTLAKGSLWLFLIQLLPFLSFGQCNELFFSEYLEGASNDKCLEIFNPTMNPISLDGAYVIGIYFNGSTSAATIINLSGTVPAAGVFIICHSSFGVEPLFGITDQLASNLSFNGNDAVGLLDDNGNILDVIGQIGFNPGSQWGTDPTSTQNNVIVRKSSVGDGDEDGSDPFDPSIEWDGFDQSEVEGFGSHFIDFVGGACDCDPPTAICQDVTVNLNEGGEISAEDVDNGSTFDCGFGSIDLSDGTFGCDEVGANTITLTATDSQEGTSICTATVTVIDPTPPTAVCMNATTMIIEGTATISGNDVDGGSTDNCSTNTEVDPNTFSCDDIGDGNVVTLTVSDNGGNSSSCTAMVTVVDDFGFCCEGPQASCMDATISLTVEGAFLGSGEVDMGSTGCGELFLEVNPNYFECEDLGPNTVTLTVSDDTEESDQCTATVTVVDIEGVCCSAPTLFCPEDLTFFNDEGECSAATELEGPDLAEGCGEVDLDFRYRSKELGEDPGSWTSWMTNAMVTLPVGRWQIQWRAMDEENNEDHCKYIIEVIDNEAPEAICKSNTVCLGPFDVGEFSLEDLLDLENSGDNCGYSYSLSSYGFDCEDLGTTKAVMVTLTDDAGLSANCTASIDVELCPGLPQPWTNCSIGTESTETGFNPCTDEFELSTVGFPMPNYDVNAFVYQEVCGDFEIIAQVADIENPGWGGIVARESCDPGSKKVAVKSQLTPIIRRDARVSTGGFVNSKQLPHPVSQGWLRLVRTGNLFTAYTSFDGINWYFAIHTFVPMNSCVLVGLFVEGINVATVTTVNFQNVSINHNASLVAPVELPELDLHQTSVELADFNVFPNPASGEVNVVLDHFVGQQVDLTIYNSLGQIVKTRRVDEVRQSTANIDLNDLKTGSYLMQIQTDKVQLTKKFIVDK